MFQIADMTRRTAMTVLAASLARAAGKLPKVALVAAMRKLLAAVYSVSKNRRPFVPLLTPVEAIS